MNPDTNKFEPLERVCGTSCDHGIGELSTTFSQFNQLLRPNGEPVPKHWTQFQVGELVIIKDYTFKVAYIGETSILLEPVGVPIVGKAP